MSDLFESIIRIDKPEIKGAVKQYEILNTATDGLLDKVALACRSQDFPNLFVGYDKDPNSIYKQADFFTTSLDIRNLTEAGQIVTSWHNSLWHSKKTNNELDGLLISNGPPDARNIVDLPNRIFTESAKKLMTFVYENGHEERPGKVDFNGWEVDPLWQFEASFWNEQNGLINKIPYVEQKSLLEIKLRRQTVLDSFSGRNWIGTVKLKKERFGNVKMFISMDESMGKGDRVGVLEIDMPSNRTNTVCYRLPKITKGVNLRELDNGLLNNIVYNRYIDDGRYTLTRAEIIKPLFQSLGIALGIV